MRAYSMAYLTANGAGPVEAVSIAAEAGFDMISFRLLPAGPGDAPPPLLTDDALFAEVMAAMRDAGLTMADAEMIRLAAETDLASFRPFLDRIAAMGARHILVAIDDTDRARATDSYARLCELIDPYGLTADLEFMPWTGCRTLNDAIEIAEAADHPRAAVLFDALHFDRCGATLEDLSALPPRLVNYVQICDGPAVYDPSDAGLIQVARNARLVPGEGGVDLPAIARLLPREVPVSVEVVNFEQARREGRAAFAARALAATRALMEG